MGNLSEAGMLGVCLVVGVVMFFAIKGGGMR